MQEKTTYQNLKNKGFSFVEIVVVIAIMVVLLAVLTPTIITHTEQSRIQKDESAMDEVCSAIQLALNDADTFDEAFSYSVTNNYVVYTDSSGLYGTCIEDEEFWAPDGAGNALTITFNPDENGNYNVADGIINDIGNGNGSVPDDRPIDDNKKCYFADMGNQKLYTSVKQTIGNSFISNSATYRNSSYTVFIRFSLIDGMYHSDVYGSFNGTNLSPDCDASIGSGTSEYTPEGEAVMTTPNGGTQTPDFSQSDLGGSGGGGGNYTPPDNPENTPEVDPEEPEQPANNGLEPGLYPSGTIMAWKAGEDVSNTILRTWDNLLATQVVYESNGIVRSNFVRGPYTNGSSDELAGDLVLPSGITTLGEAATDNNAFAYCKKLTGIYIPSTVKIINRDAFIKCVELQHIVFEENSQLTTMGSEFCMYNSKLEYINLEDTQLTTMETYRQFYNCSSLKTIQLPPTLTNIPNEAFYYCTALESITIPAAVKTIGSYSFYGCSKLTSLTFSADAQLEKIDKLAFFDINVPSLWFPKSITAIEHQAFCSVDNLTSIIFEEGGTQPLVLGEQSVFRSTPNLTEVHLPQRLSSMKSYTFDGANSLKVIHYGGTQQEWENVSKSSSWKPPRLEQVICIDGNSHMNHTGGTATCTARKVCDVCGLSYGNTLAHTGGRATCTQRKICTVCNNEYGDLAAHRGGTATCQNLKVCTVCGTEYGSLAGHTGGTATCIKGKICTVCGIEYGSLAAHKGGTATCIALAKCEVCNQDYGSYGTNHVGGTATCQQRAVCDMCHVEYGSFADHQMVNNVCAVCGKNVTIIESPHDYANNQNYVILGTWDYSGAQSVDIVIEYETESTVYDWLAITANLDYVSGTSHSQMRNYLSTSGSIISATGTSNSVKFGGTTRTTKVFTNIPMTQGTVVLRSDGGTVDWGAKVTITPNY